jgi:multidrug efflux pump subunit AcrA (membrane-fusion protein)
MALPIRKDNVIEIPVAPKHLPHIRCLDELRAPRASRPLALIVSLLLIGIALALRFVPWQQSVTGKGQVIIFSPMDRPQNIEAQITGRLKKWNVVEGQVVKAGEAIAEIDDIDPKFLDPQQVTRLQAQKTALIESRAAAEARLASLANQLSDLDKSRNVAIPGAEQRMRIAKDRLRVAEQAVEQARQNVETAQLNLKRIQDLYDNGGLRSKRDLELAELEIVTQRTRYESALAQLEVGARDIDVAGLDKDRVVNDTSATLNGLRVTMASVRESIAKYDGDIQKLDVEIQNVVQRTGQRVITAPRDGRVVSVEKVGAGETVKAGTVLAVLAPTTQDQAVEIYLSDFDAPLVTVGREVRLFFNGWPAVQFVGWPSVAVGTFAGKVKVMDAIDDGKGRVRMIVEPDYEKIAAKREEPWPPLAQLRPGTEVRGWVMLSNVSLGWELWRQFNAFPASLPDNPGKEKKDSLKAKKEESEEKDSSEK